ncbi:hypothetical protein G9P44_000182 [Scheffersomyces stipitis]|nr:hypothetical protein G9P44_000182 [Scheffersomyces stipitis]
MTEEYRGSCVCGSIEFTVRSKPEATLVCYCTDCRKGAGHLGQVLAKYETSKVEIQDKNSSMKEYTITKTQSGFPKKKLFCGECGCSILTKPMKHNGEVTFLRSTLLDNSFGDFIPKKAIFGDVKQGFVDGAQCEYL